MMPGGAAALYVPQTVLEEWFAHARAGQRTIYVRGVADGSHEVVKLVRDWSRTGEATCSQGRDRDTGELLYYVTRCRPAQNDAARASGARSAIDEAERETPDGKIYLALRRAANLGLPCPSNAQLAELAGLRDADAARYVLRKLQQAAKIDVKLSGRGRSFRRVRIVETGRMTADEPGAAREVV